MEKKTPGKHGPYRIIRMLHGTKLWTEHLGVYDTISGHGELCRLWLPKRGSIKDDKVVARKLSSLLALRHENLDRVIDAGVGERGAYVAFEYQPCRMLDDIVRVANTEDAGLSVPVCLYIGIETLTGLSALQSDDKEGSDFHHGFVGPQSISISATGQVKLRYQGLTAACDWDLDTLTRAFGLETEKLSHAEDVRAVALTLKQLLFPPGSGAFKTGPEMPAGLARIIARALSPAPQLYFEDADSMLGELLALQTKLWEVCTAVQMSEFMQQLFGGELDEEAEEAAQLTGAKSAPIRAVSDLGHLERSLPLGSLIDGRYRLIRELGQGSAGIVYEAEHVELRTQVAIKMLDRDYCRDQRRVERFRREARASSKIGHPHIIRVNDLGQTDDGRFFYVMDFISGETLGDLIRRIGYLDEDRAVSIMAQVCEAVDAAHKKSIIHRDLKPENILLSRDAKDRENALVADFGLSLTIDSNEKRLTKEGQAVGTPYFMSPEQVRGEPTDPRTDVYAAGIILYEALTGVPMFDYPTVAETLTAHLHDTPVPFAERTPDANISRSLEAVVLRAVEKDPLERYQSMKELGEALEKALEKALETHAMPYVSPPSEVEETFDPASIDIEEVQPSLWQQRSPRILALAVAVILVAGTTIMLWPRGGTNVAGATDGVQGADRTKRSDAGRGNAPDAAPAHVTEEVDASLSSTQDEAVKRIGVLPDTGAKVVKRPTPQTEGEPQGPTAAELVREGTTLLSRGQPAKAAHLCRRAVRSSSGNAGAWACLGRAAFEQGNHSAAALNLKRAVSLRPRSIRYRLLLAGALTRAGRSGDARREYEEVLRIDPDNAVASRMLNR